MKIAIIGSGFFGCAAALILSKNHNVDIYEQKNDILQGASSANQFRFHLGFHYPRSQKTIHEIQKTNRDFINFFGKTFFGNTKNYYGIARYNNKINFSKYLKVLKKNKLNFKVLKKNHLDIKSISDLLIVDEKILNYFKFKKYIKSQIRKKNINLLLETEFDKKLIKKYDKIIVATYSNNNTILKVLGCKLNHKYEYQLVEKILVKIPKEFLKDSYVIIDGDFVNIDPYLGTNYHLLSDVIHSKIEKIKSYEPIFKDKRKKYINKGLIKDKGISKFNKFIEHSKTYLPFLSKAKYIGSYYTVRTILPNLEKTDERIGVINQVDGKFISIFSSKWNSCISTAYKIDNIIK
jgi:hypothetical protein